MRFPLKSLSKLFWVVSTLFPLAVSAVTLNAREAAPANDRSGSRWASSPPLVATWLREDGLPQNAVSAIEQSRSGYLWMGTYNGLARFDGARFEIFDADRLEGLSGNRITALWEDPNGVLWVGEENGNLARVTDGGQRSEAVPRKWESQPITAIRQDAEGEHWILNRIGRLIRVSDGLTRIVYEETVTDPGVWRLAADTDGSLWFLGYTDLGYSTRPTYSRLVRLRGGKMEEWSDFGDPEAGVISAVGESNRGGVWIVVDDRIRRWQRGGWVEDRGRLPVPEEHISSFHETRDGALVISILDVGVLLLAPGAEPRMITTDEGLANDWVNAITEDREGNLWLATAGGLSSLRPRRVEMVAPEDRFGRKSVLGLAQSPDGALWVGTEGAGLYRLHEGGFRRFTEDDGLTKPFIWAVEAESKDRIWVGTWGQGLFLGRNERFDVAPGWDPAAITVTALLRGADGTLWAGTNLGLERWDGNEWTSWRAIGGEPLGHVRCLAEDDEGRLWFGMSGAGLGVLEEGEIRVLGREDGLANENVWALLSVGDSLWIGTAGGGLGRLKNGGFSWLTREQGLPDDMICSIALDSSGRFWFTSFSGVFSIPQTELAAKLGGEVLLDPPLVLTVSDGLPTSECAGGLQSPALLDGDGVLWVSTPRGLARLRTDRIKRQTLAPLVKIQAGLVGDEILSDEWDRELVIPPGRHRVEVRYTAINFSAPEQVRFRYRLEGLEDRWVDLGNQRSLSFSYLPPGKYRLHLIASNRDGFWNEEGAALSIVAKPAWWQMLSVRIAGAALGAGLLVFVVAKAAGRRSRRKMEELKRRHAVERERTRIARDLHDDLGATLTRLTLLSQNVPGNGIGELKEHFNRIRQTTVDITRSMDEVVWAVNPKHDTLESLAAYLSRFAQEFLAGAGVRCRLDLPLDIPDVLLTADFRHNLYLACKEALHNVVRHAHASEVVLALHFDSSTGLLELGIKDDGCGFDAGRIAAEIKARSPGNSHGDGLANISMRITAFGGRTSFESVPGEGAMVRFIVPVRSPMAAKNRVARTSLATDRTSQ